MKVWKVLFWITIISFIVSNTFWIYQVVDNAVGHGYYKASCEEYKANSEILELTLRSYGDKDELIDFLEEKAIQFEIHNKADNENYIVIGTLDIQFNDDGEIIMEKE